MALETGTYISDLVSTNPVSADPKSQGDDHLRLLKSTIKTTFPNVTGAVTATQDELNIIDGATLSTAELNILDGVTASTAEINIMDGVTASTAELNYVDGVTSNIQTQFTGVQANIDLKADIDSPTLTGVPRSTTASFGASGTQIATLDFVAASSFASSLPAQTGNSGKLISTDGSNASWGATVNTSVMSLDTGGAFVGTTESQTLSAKTLKVPIVCDSADTTKKANFILSSVTAGQNRGVTIADEDMTLFTPYARLISVTSASNSASVSVTIPTAGVYSKFILEVEGLTVQTNAQDLSLQMTIGGSLITGSVYRYHQDNWVLLPSNATSIRIFYSLSNEASADAAFTIKLSNPEKTTITHKLLIRGVAGGNDASSLNVSAHTGICETVGALSALTFSMGSGNIVAGNFRLYGIRKT